VIGIAGGTGSGKSTVAQKLAAAIPRGRCVAIEHDAYYKDVRPTCRTPSARASTSTTRVARQRALLRAPRRRCAPGARSRSRATTSSRTPASETDRLEPSPIIVVEGILVLALPACATAST
jgi:uridine kinase